MDVDAQKLVARWRAEVADPKYNFVRAANPCLLVPGGSQLYGTANDRSDLDLRGVFVESFETFTGITDRKSIVVSDHDRDVDVQLNTVMRTLRLAAAGNPTILETLFCPEQYVIAVNDVGQLVRQAAPKLMSTQAVADAYDNYAANQTVRVRNALAHRLDKSGKAEAARARLEIYLNRVRRELDVSEDAFRVYVVDDEAVVDVNLKGYNFANYRSIGSALRQISAAVKVSSAEASQRDLRKQASHIVRLVRTGTDVLLGNMNVDRRGSGDVDLLMAIRSGEVPLDDEFFKLVAADRVKFDEARQHSVWPTEVDVTPVLTKFAGVLLDIHHQR